jgi:hypothetical protein
MDSRLAVPSERRPVPTSVGRPHDAQPALRVRGPPLAMKPVVHDNEEVIRENNAELARAYLRARRRNPYGPLLLDVVRDLAGRGECARPARECAPAECTTCASRDSCLL